MKYRITKPAKTTYAWLARALTGIMCYYFSEAQPLWMQAGLLQRNIIKLNFERITADLIRIFFVSDKKKLYLVIRDTYPGAIQGKKTTTLRFALVVMVNGFDPL